MNTRTKGRQQQRAPNMQGTGVSTYRENQIVQEEQKFERIKTAIDKRSQDIARALAGMVGVEAFVQQAIVAIATAEPDTREKLLKCTPDSFALALLRAAFAGLMLDGRQAALVPYGSVATCMVMVKGRINLISRCESVDAVWAHHVLEGDHFEVLQGTTEQIIHRPKLDRKPGEKAEVTFAYAVVKLKNGSSVHEVVPRWRIDEIRDNFSKAPKSPMWTKSFPQAAEKVALNRVERLVDTDAETTRRMAAARDIEFQLPAGQGITVDDPEASAAERVRNQVDQQRERLQDIQLRQQEAEEKKQRDDLLAMIVTAADKHTWDPDAAADQAAQALGSDERWTDEPRDEAGIPIGSEISLDALRAILAHFEGFGKTDAEKAAMQEPAVQVAKVEPLQCRILAKIVHLIDPQREEKPPVCIGCGAKVGGQQGANGYSAIADPTVYCPPALRAAKLLDLSRVPDPMIEAAKAVE